MIKAVLAAQAVMKKLLRKSSRRDDEGLDHMRLSQMVWTLAVGVAVMAAAIYRLSAPGGLIIEQMQDPGRAAASLLAPNQPVSGLDRAPATR